MARSHGSEQGEAEMIALEDLKKKVEARVRDDAIYFQVDRTLIGDSVISTFAARKMMHERDKEILAILYALTAKGGAE